MTRRKLIFALLAAVGLTAEIVDRVAVSVGLQVIPESAVLLDIRLTAFLDRKPLLVDAATKRAAADRLVDQMLILREADDSHLVLPTSDNAARLVAQVKQEYPSDADYQAELRLYGVEESDLAGHLLAGLKTLTFTDLRFRPAVQIPEEDARAYYEKLKAGQPGAAAPPFEEARDEVERLLKDQRALDALDEWLKSARTQARPVYREAVFR